jgi:AraC-like DNA-binding protein
LGSLIRSASLTNYAEVARTAGLDPSRMLREFGLPPRCIEQPDVVVPIDAVRSLLEASAERSGIDGFGLLMAEARRLSNLGPLGLLIREQPTLELALEAFVTYGRRLNDSLLLKLEEIGDVVLLREELVMGHGGPVRQSTELAVGVAFRMLRQFLGPDWRPRRVCFAHDAPADLSIHKRIFGTCVEFGHDFNGIACARADLDRANPEADPELARLARDLLDAQSPDAPAVTARGVREMVVTLLATGACSVERVAQHMGVDRRTIHRRLANEGASFSAIVDAVRLELSERLLMEGRRLGEIASLLGFSTPSAFSHWYRRHHPEAPSRRRSAMKRARA